MQFRNEIFLTADEDVNEVTTAIDGTDFNSAQIGLAFASIASITVEVTGSNAASAGNVNFIFVAYNSTFGAWDTTAYVSITLAAAGVATKYKTVALTADIEKIKLFSIQNEDTAYNAICNAAIHIREV